MGEDELVRAQLAALSAWHQVRRERYAAALAGLADTATRADAAARLERLARQHSALLDRADAAPAPARRSRGPRTVLLGDEVTGLARRPGELDVVAHLLDLDAAVGVVVAEQPDVVVVGLDLAGPVLQDVVADVRTFSPGSCLAGYGGRAPRGDADVPLWFPTGTLAATVATALRRSADRRDEPGAPVGRDGRAPGHTAGNRHPWSQDRAGRQPPWTSSPQPWPRTTTSA